MISSVICVLLGAYTSIDPFVLDTIAMFDVTAPSAAFKVHVSGCGMPSGHSVEVFSGPCGYAVALKTNACTLRDATQGSL